MEIKYRNYNNVLYVMLSGELDEHTAKYTSKQLDEIFMSTISKQIIIDLSEYLDCPLRLFNAYVSYGITIIFCIWQYIQKLFKHIEKIR